MAGKTFRGVGDAKGGSSRDGKDAVPRIADEDDDDPRGLHSGPTVVDDAKVAEVLKKLRTLDRPPGPLTGVTEVVRDGDSSGPTRVDSGPAEAETAPVRIEAGTGLKVDPGPASLQDIMYPLQRPTAIGRSQGTPATEQPVTIPAELARGTLFGRSIHLPDVNAPDESAIELSSGAVQIDDGSPSQPFPLAERHAIMVPAPVAPPQRFHTDYDHPDTHTEVPLSRSKGFAKVIAMIGGVAVVGMAWFGWTNMRGKVFGPDPTPAPPAQPTPPPSAPAIEQLPAPPGAAAVAAPDEGPSPTAAPTREGAAPAPAPAPAPAAATPPKPAAAEPTPAPAPNPAPTAAADEPASTPAARKSSRRSASERRSARKAADATPTRASKPSKSRQPAVLEDPDATLEPSL